MKRSRTVGISFTGMEVFFLQGEVTLEGYWSLGGKPRTTTEKRERMSDFTLYLEQNRQEAHEEQVIELLKESMKLHCDELTERLRKLL